VASTSSIKAGAAYIELSTKDSRLVKGLNDAAKRLDAFGKSLQGIGTKMAMLGAGIVTPLAGAAKVFANIGGDLDDISQRTGTSVEALSELSWAVQLAGTDMATFEGSLRKMQRLIVKATEGSGEATNAFRSLGIEISTLIDLSPDEQFKAIAEGISQVEDPAHRTAMAMDIFGKSGTALMPMLLNGAKGIEEFQKQAREMGLTISTEDAQAAAGFGDAMDALWKVLTRAAFAIGAALAPVLAETVQLLTRITIVTTQWIKQNKSAVLWVFKVGAAIAVAGGSMVAFGAIATGLGSVLGGLALAATWVGTAIAAIGSMLVSILSPIGLTIVGLSTLVAYLLYATGAGAQAMQWLGDRFNDLRDTALAAWQGIGDALATGDIALAGKILWLTLKMEWQRGIAFLESKWLDFKGYFVGVFQSAVFSVAGLMTDAWAGLQTGWLETTHFIADSWTVLISLLQKGWNRFSGFFQKVWARIQGLFGDTNAEAEIAKINEEIARQDGLIDQGQNQTLMEREAKRAAQRDQIERDRLGSQSALGDMQAQEQAALAAANQKALQDSEAELAKARAEWQAALGDASKRRAESPTGTSSALKIPGFEIPTGAGLDQLLAETKKKTDVVGTFNPLAAMNLGADSLGERTAKASEEVAANTKKLVQQAKQGGLVFG
jgi:hypothetical protein